MLRRLSDGRFRIQAQYFCLALSILLVTLYNFPFWRHVIATRGGISRGDIAFLLSLWLLLVALTHAFISLLCAKFVLRPAAIVLVLSASIALYFIHGYGILIDPSMIENVAETDPAEVRDLLNPGIFVFVLLTGLLPALLITRVRIVYRGVIRQLALNLLNMAAGLIVASIILFGFYEDYASLSQNHRDLRFLLLPSSYIHSTFVYIRSRADDDTALITVGADAAQAPAWSAHARRSVTVLVVGETARAANFGIYGYGRNTTPELAKENLIGFNRVHSCGTSTAVSLPCMFSNLTRREFEKAEALRRENLLDVVSRAGLRVVWRDNDSGCKDVCDRIEYEDLSMPRADALCNSEECYDEILLQGLDELIDRSERDLLIVLHQKGSHGPAYYKRVPGRFRRFTPVCADSDLKHCSTEEIVNAYDNTILYTDYFLGRLLGMLKQRATRKDTALLYLSDHGESLGEDNLYLHGTPYLFAPEEQTHVPFLVWLSQSYAQDFGIDSQCLRQKAGGDYSHDNLFHSLLGMLDI
ncbi:MAG TPA: phosphoethanolamine--lipid A transferase, partial [Gammaproteobacteria bacterium]|nr:phosphoethanolamine--lipid A transferase [Gammaproteobacteria bacterium]